MTKRFDPSRAYGEVYGHSSGAKYEQDGALFDAQGNIIGEEPPVVQKRAPRAKKPVESVVDDQLAANLAEVVGGLEN